MFVPCIQVNLKAHHVEYNHFYIPDITSMVDIQEDYLNWFLSKAQIVSVAARLIINFKYLYKILKCLLLLRFWRKWNHPLVHRYSALTKMI